MKRILCTILALCMLCGMLAMTSCNKAGQSGETTTEATTTEATTTEATTTEATTTEATTTEATTTEETKTGEETPAFVYAEWETYNDGVFSFVYPKGWSKTESTVADSNETNSISVVTEPKNDEYAQMDTETFKSSMEAVFEMMGLTLSDAFVEQRTLANGLDATIMYYAIEMENIWLCETTLAITIDDTTYGIIIMEDIENTNLVENVIESLVITPAENTGAEDGLKTYTNGDISFAYPAAWVGTESGGVVTLTSGSGNNITIVSEPSNDAYMAMTAEDFGKELQPVFEMMGLSMNNITLNVTKNRNGIAMVVISYDLEMENFWMCQTLYIVTVGEKTYTVTVTEAEEDAELVAMVFDTLNIVA